MHHSRGVWNRLNILPWKQASWSLFRFHIFSKSLSSHSSGTSWSTDYIILSFWVWQRISFPEALSKVISNRYFNVYYFKCHNIDSKFSTFETLLEPFGATIELQIFWSPQGPCRQNHDWNLSGYPSFQVISCAVLQEKNCCSAPFAPRMWVPQSSGTTPGPADDPRYFRLPSGRFSLARPAI